MPTPEVATPHIEFRGVSKRFGPVLANNNVSFTVKAGSLHGIVGENGAGKSTIVKILYGMYEADAGEIRLGGQSVAIPNPQVASSHGIGMVHQHFMQVPTLTGWENILLGRESTWLFYGRREAQTEIESVKSSFGFHVDLSLPVEQLCVGHQQQIEILKLLYRNSDVLILDEPTAVLTPSEVEFLFEKLRRLVAEGKTILLITHKLSEILRWTENVTVMRQGSVVGTYDTAELTQPSLAEKMVGRLPAILTHANVTRTPTPILSVRNLSCVDRLRGLSFDVFGGEILGIAGVEGNGQHELAEILAGVQTDFEGDVSFGDRRYPSFSTYSLKRAGVGVIPPDRHQEAVVLRFPVADNFALGHQRDPVFQSHGFIQPGKLDATVRPQLDRFDIQPRDPRVPISSLSGGNQQKVVLARELSRNPSFMLACHPTRGVDIGAIEKIHSELLALRERGGGVLLMSSELDEILALSDRILVLYAGKIVGSVDRKSATETQLGQWMTGGQG